MAIGLLCVSATGIVIQEAKVGLGPLEQIIFDGINVPSTGDRMAPLWSMIGVVDVKEVAGLLEDVRR